MALVPKAEEEEINPGVPKGRDKSVRDRRLLKVTGAILIRVMLQKSKGSAKVI